MQNLKILNKKETKEIIELINQQWGCNADLDYAFLKNNKERLFIVNKEISRVDFEKLRINTVGLYFGEISDAGIRLSIEGSQLVGRYAKKNVVELNDKEARLFAKGVDLEKETDMNGFVIIKSSNDFLGCGKVKDGKILNYFPKTRRINAAD